MSPKSNIYKISVHVILCMPVNFGRNGSIKSTPGLRRRRALLLRRLLQPLRQPHGHVPHGDRGAVRACGDGGVLRRAGAGQGPVLETQLRSGTLQRPTQASLFVPDVKNVTVTIRPTLDGDA
jgi:hypothetical protein